MRCVGTVTIVPVVASAGLARRLAGLKLRLLDDVIVPTNRVIELDDHGGRIDEPLGLLVVVSPELWQPVEVPKAELGKRALEGLRLGAGFAVRVRRVALTG